MSEWDIKWKLSYSNYLLYIASIPVYDEKEPEVVIEKDAADAF